MVDIEKLDKEREASIQYLTKPWKNFFNRFKEIEDTKISQWNHTHLLAHFDKRFREFYNKNFSYTCRGAPSKCTEIVLMKRMCAMLSTTSMQIAKDYIDWVFDYKIKPNNMKIRSLGLLGSHGLGNEFKEYKEKQTTIERGTKLPEDYMVIISKYSIPLKTFGDLAFLKLRIDQTINESLNHEYKKLFNDLYTVGFDDSMIKGIK